MNEAEQFFYDHAGWSYHPDKETSEQGRQRGAAQLAAAERWVGHRDGWSFMWADDSGGDHSYLDDPPETCEICTLVDDRGYARASLGCIDDADDDYRRVVEAELALDAMP